jgi:hypothetical protein
MNMHTFTALATTTAAAAIAFTGLAMPAHAEAVVYDSYGIRSNPPGAAGHEYSTLDIPTGYGMDRLDWHTVDFFEQVDQGRAIIMDLHPESDTVRDLKAERATFAEEAGDSYEELAFKVNDKDYRVRARWVFTYAEEGTGDVAPFISVMLMGGNQLRVVGKLAEREQVERIREHVVRSVAFPS